MMRLSRLASSRFVLSRNVHGSTSLISALNQSGEVRRYFNTNAKPEPVRLRLPEDHAQINRGIREWFKKEGDEVKQGEELCEVDSGDVVYDFVSPINGIIVKITAKKGSIDLKGGEVIGYMATSLDNVTSVAYEAAKEIAEGRVLEHPIVPRAVEEKPSNNADAFTKWLATMSGGDSEFESEYLEKLKSEGFNTIESFATLDEEDLNAMNITKRAHRKIFLNAAIEAAKLKEKKA